MIRLFCVPQRNGINRIKERGGVWREKKSEREREIYHKELAHTIIEAEKPKICNLQAGDLGEPVEGVVPI